MNSTRTRTDLFGILLAARQATAPQLIELAQPLGISASNVKSHLSRLVGEGVVLRRGPARQAVYSLTERQRPVVEGIEVRLEEPPDTAWNGDWLSLALQMPTAREAREALRASLWFDGFRPWGREVWLRPAWPLPWAVERAQAYVSAGGWCVCGPVVGTANPAGVQALYRMDRLDREAHAMADVLGKRKARLRSDAEAFAARLHLAGRVIDVIARDPRLPSELCAKFGGLKRLRRCYRELMHETEARAAAFVAGVLASGSVTRT